MKKGSLYNEEALERLRSPEQLDVLLRITQPVGWVALCTCIFLVLSILFWSFFGVFSTSVKAVGIIMDSSRLIRISHEMGGKIEQIVVTQGSNVKKGDVLAIVRQLAIDTDILDAQQRVLTATNKQELLNSAANMNVLMNKKNRFDRILSTCDGIVTEIQANVGDIVTPGLTTLCTIREKRQAGELSALMYVPVKKGKRIKPSMMVQLEPSGVDTGMQGSLVGVVRSVSNYPVSQAGALKTLGNLELVQWIMQALGGTVMEVKVDLIRDTSSSSGYLWTSSLTDQPVITAGSVCSGSVIVEKIAPIEKVFLKLSQWLRSS